jgi:outer membrane protein insertion porin family
MSRLQIKLLCFSLIQMVFSVLLIVDSVAERNQAVVNRIQIIGNDYIDKNMIAEQLSIKQGHILPPVWPDQAITRLIQWYHDQGYYFVRIDSFQTVFSRDSSQVDLLFAIDEGEQVRIGPIQIAGLSQDEEKEMRQFMHTRTSHLFNESAFERDMEEVLTYWENQSFPLCQAEVQKLIIEKKSGSPRLELGLSIDKGPPVYIGGLSVRGNRVTRNHVILRETRLKLGHLYRHRDVVAAKTALRRLGYFRKVDDPEITFVQDQAFITYSITESNTNSIDGVIGYHPPETEKEPGYWTGRLQFTFQNLLGTGRFLDVYWEKKDAYSQAMRFGYEEPWLLGWPVHIGGQFQQEIRDTTYIERKWQISFRYVPWTSLSLNIQGGQRSILPDSLGSVLYNLAQTRSWFLTLGFQYNSMDDPWNPRKGVRYYTTLTLGRKRNLGPDFIIQQEGWKRTVNTRRVQIDAEGVFTLFNRQVLYFGAHGTEVKTGEKFVPVSDQVWFGGARSLRGYGEDMFRGSLIAWLNSEYRYLLGSRSRIFLFIDTGLYQRKQETGTIEGMKVGYGFGIRIETRLGLFGMDYGLGEGDSFLQGKVHVGLVNWF